MKIPKKININTNNPITRLSLLILAATAISVFCLASSKALIAHGNYQTKVLKARNKTIDQLKENKKNLVTLNTQYNTYLEGDEPSNVLGGRNIKSLEAVPPDGTNASIILDALPPTYDFAALISSVNKILAGNSLIAPPSIGAQDQSTTMSNEPSAHPQAALLTLTVAGSSNYANLQKLVRDFERSVRPFDILSMQLSGNDANINFSMKMNTYYQPPKALDISSQEVR